MWLQIDAADKTKTADEIFSVSLKAVGKSLVSLISIAVNIGWMQIIVEKR